MHLVANGELNKYINRSCPESSGRIILPAEVFHSKGRWCDERTCKDQFVYIRPYVLKFVPYTNRFYPVNRILDFSE